MHYRAGLKSFLVLMIILVVGFCGNSFSASVTLQQGVDGYVGCKDTYIASGGYPAEHDHDVNFGNSGTIYINSEQYKDT